MAGAGTQNTENGVCSEVNSCALKVGCSDDKVVSRYLDFSFCKCEDFIPNSFHQRFTVHEGKELRCLICQVHLLSTGIFEASTLLQ